MMSIQISLGVWQRITLLGVALISILATLLPLYLTYTLVGHSEILGLQGRYFLPMIFYLIIAGCINKPLHFFSEESIQFIIAIIVPIAINITLFIKYLW